MPPTKAVALVAASESTEARAEYFADPTDDRSQAMEWTMPKGRFVDALLYGLSGWSEDAIGSSQSDDITLLAIDFKAANRLDSRPNS